MPIHLLSRLARQSLPAIVENGGDIDAVRILVLAGHVKALVPAPTRQPFGPTVQPPATVTEITRLGRLMLQRFGRD